MDFSQWLTSFELSAIAAAFLSYWSLTGLTTLLSGAGFAIMGVFVSFCGCSGKRALKLGKPGAFMSELNILFAFCH